MSRELIALVALGAILVCTITVRRRFISSPLNAALIGTIASLIATAAAAVAFVAVDLRELSLQAAVLGPIYEGAPAAALATIVLGQLQNRLGRTAFTVVATLTGAIVSWVIGELFIGRSPHFSHERAVAFLMVSWSAVSLVTAVVLQRVTRTPK